ncbi:MAG: xanthine dehydrogenase family protein subunit M, partial [Chloroflexota bacterium]
GGLAIGALTTWAALLDDPRIRGYGLLADAIPTIGDLQVRNRGTIGGSLAHADPASDIAAPVLALEAELVARSSARGERTIAASDFFIGPFATALEPDEILTEIRLPAGLPNAGSAYCALPSPASGYPIAGVAVVLIGQEAGAGVERCTVGVTGVGEQPYRSAEAERAVLDGASFADAAESISVGQRISSDIHADREYRAAMAVVMARRAFEAAVARLS